MLYYAAMTASQRLAEDKETGALELILSTPTTERTISRGLWLAYGALRESARDGSFRGRSDEQQLQGARLFVLSQPLRRRHRRVVEHEGMYRQPGPEPGKQMAEHRGGCTHPHHAPEKGAAT